MTETRNCIFCGGQNHFFRIYFIKQTSDNFTLCLKITTRSQRQELNATEVRKPRLFKHLPWPWWFLASQQFPERGTRRQPALGGSLTRTGENRDFWHQKASPRVPSHPSPRAFHTLLQSAGWVVKNNEK